MKLSVAAGGYGQPARLTVADTGQGIPAELLPHVFDRFLSGAWADLPDHRPRAGAGQRGGPGARR